MSIPTKIAKRIAGECCYSGCTERALDDGDYCAPHDAVERARDAGKKRRRRLGRARAGRCVSCGKRKVGKQRKPDGSLVLRRCPSCSKSHSKAARDRRGVPGNNRGVPGDPSEPERVTREVEGDGYARTRFHGQPRRGQQPRWQLDVQDLDDAIDRLRRAKRGVLLAVDAEQAQMPRVQRDEIRFEAMSQAAHARRFIEEITERNGYDDDEMIDSVEKTGR